MVDFTTMTVKIMFTGIRLSWNVCQWPSSPSPIRIGTSPLLVLYYLWICPFCLSHNSFPPHYKDISNTNLPAELLSKCTAIDYTLTRPAQNSPIFLFVDTCLDEDDLKALRDAIVVSLSLIPPYALVGLMTYGTMVLLCIFFH